MLAEASRRSLGIWIAAARIFTAMRLPEFEPMSGRNFRGLRIHPGTGSGWIRTSREAGRASEFHRLGPGGGLCGSWKIGSESMSMIQEGLSDGPGCRRLGLDPAYLCRPPATED